MLALPFAALGAAGGTAAYLDGPPPAHTGGFGEPNCRACHFDNGLEAEGGRLTVSGLPERYVPGERYTLTIVLTRGEMERGGFQVALRYADGPGAGRQAGVLTAPAGRVTVLRSEPGVNYAQHTIAGTGLAGPDSIAWTLHWRAPEAGTVALHLAANAANGDGSEFGDHIYVLERRVGAEK